MKATKITGEGAIKPFIGVRLWDDGMRGAVKTFQLGSSTWQHESVKVGPEAYAEWIVDSGFNWSSIKEIVFAFTQEQVGIGANIREFFRVDGLLFHFLINVSLISVGSNPFSGVPVRIDGIEDLTPAVWEIDPPSIRQVTIASKHDGWVFDHWDDGILTPGRTVDASQPGVYILTAFYKETTPPTGPAKWYPGYYLQYVMKLVANLSKSLTRQ